MRTTVAERAGAATIAVLLLVAGTVAAVRSRPGARTASGVDRSERSSAVAGTGASPNGAGVEQALSGAGLELPPGTDIYAVRIGKDGRSPFGVQAGDGGQAADFWPASSIKVLVAVAALEYAGSLGFSGEATLTFDTGTTATLREIYDAAIRDSSNEDYDLLVQITGLDRLNDEFLTPAKGFPETVIRTAYAGSDLALSPGITFSEGPRSLQVPPRQATGDYGCPGGNCSTLFEMVESVRRVLVDDELPPPLRFAVAPADLRRLRSSLLGADGFFNAGAAAALGPGTRVYSKPGWAPGRDCVDVAFIEGEGQRFLLGVATPERGEEPECASLSTVADGVLRFLHGP